MWNATNVQDGGHDICGSRKGSYDLIRTDQGRVSDNARDSDSSFCTEALVQAGRGGRGLSPADGDQLLPPHLTVGLHHLQWPVREEAVVVSHVLERVVIMLRNNINE